MLLISITGICWHLFLLWFLFFTYSLCKISLDDNIPFLQLNCYTQRAIFTFNLPPKFYISISKCPMEFLPQTRQYSKVNSSFPPLYLLLSEIPFPSLSPTCPHFLDFLTSPHSQIDFFSKQSQIYFLFLIPTSTTLLLGPP